METIQKKDLIECLQNLSNNNGFSSLENFRLYKESIKSDNCFKHYKSAYPEYPIVSTSEDKIYVDNLKVMTAENLYKNGSIIKLTDKVSKSIGVEQPPIGWWASEKWDGIRALWDGEKIVSRGSGVGKPKVYTYVPEWFIKCLPPGIPLDGEIWIGRGLFQKTSKLSNIKPGNTYTKIQIEKMWAGIGGSPPVVFKAFDIPGLEIPFEKRMNRLKMIIEDRKKCWEKLDYLGKKDFPIQFTEQIMIESMEQLVKLYDNITSSGAEGIMIRAPNSPYEQKRSKFMLKYKIKEDAECIVLGYVLGDGRLKGLLGSLECELINNGKLSGVISHIGTGFTDQQREEYNDKDSSNYIPIGSMVSFSYMEMTKDGIPRHPVYRGIRQDMTIVNVTKQDTTDIFNRMIQKVQADREQNWQFKRKSYQQVVDIFNNSDLEPTDITEYIEILRGGGLLLKGEEVSYKKTGNWNSSVLQKISEILRTGTLSYLKDDPRVTAVETLTKISNIGPSAAIKLYTESGISTIEQLRIEYDKNPKILNDKQSMGLKYFSDLEQRIPRQEMDIWLSIFNDIFDKTLVSLSMKSGDANLSLVGSYRRESESSGDLDFLISSSIDNPQILTTFYTFLINAQIISKKSTISIGKTKIMVIGTIDEIYRHIDIFYYNKEIYPFVLLFLTGSGPFNQEMRLEVNKLGFSLSEKGLRVGGSTGRAVTQDEYISKINKQYPETEEDIFNF